jgi:phage shock protein A
MPPKRKAIAKEPKPERAAARSSEPEDDGEVFSQTFRDRLDQFSSLSKEVLTRKAEIEGSSANQEIRDSRERVSQRVEEASAAILKEELISLEVWIADEQRTIADQIKSIHAAHHAVKATL